MKKRKAAAPYISVPRTDQFPETGNQEIGDWQWLSRIRRIFAKLMTGKAERSHESPDAESKSASMTTLSVHEQLQVLMTAEMEDRRRYGPYHQPVRYRANVDHLVHRAGEEVKEAAHCEINGLSHQTDDEPT